MIPEPSWEVFDECETCFAGPKKPCYSLRSTTKNLTKLTNPHDGRKKLPKTEKWRRIPQPEVYEL